METKAEETQTLFGTIEATREGEKPYIPRPKARKIQGDRKAWLIKHYGTMRAGDIASYLGVSEATVSRYARRLKLKR